MKKIKDELIDFTFVLPALLLFVFVLVAPFLQGVGVAFTNWDGFSPTYDFVGLKNLRVLLTDSQLLLPIKNTLLFTGVTVVCVNVLGLAVAIGLNQKIKGAALMRTIMFMPIVTSITMASIIWKYIYSDVFPLALGFSSPLASKEWVMLGISAICIWRDVGFAMVIYYAALKGIPEELIEASTIDGANAWQRFWHITFPLISPAVTTNIVYWICWGLQVYAYVATATGGGPAGSSETVAMYVYNYTFPFQKAGYGQMAGLVMMFCIYIISTTVTRILRKREEML